MSTRDLCYVIITATHTVEVEGEKYVFDSKEAKVFKKLDDKWTVTD